MTYLATNLKYLADREEIKQAALGDRLSIQQSTIQRIMAGTTENPRLDSLLAISRFFKVGLDDLVHKDLRTGGGDPSRPVGLDPDRLALVLAIVDGAISDSRKRVPDKFRARMIARVYDGQHALSGDTADAVRALLTGLIETSETQ